MIKQLSIIFLSSLLLVTTTGVPLHKHYCMGRLKSMSIFHQAGSCMDTMDKDNNIECPMDCCKDTTQLMAVDDYQTLEGQIIIEANLYFITSLAILLIDFDILFSATKNINIPHYKPPQFDLDLPVLTQSFLL